MRVCLRTAPWRGATGYFGNKGVSRKMAYSLSACSRFDAKSLSTEKIEPGQTWKVFSSTPAQDWLALVIEAG